MPGPQFVLRGKFFPPSQITTSFAGKTIIVTGSNSGVGYATAQKYVELSASTVILAVRDLSKGEAAKDAIEKATGKSGVVQVWHLDMMDFGSIDEFARRVDKLERVDVVVLNAGVVPSSFRVCEGTGWEDNLQVNCLGTALLAILLIPKMKMLRRGSELAHLVVVTSTGHIDLQLKDEDKNQLLHQYNKDLGVGPYQQHMASKMFMMWVLRELAYRTLDAKGEPKVIMNDVCPGACRSEVAREFNGYFFTVAKTIGSALVMRPAENGARVYVGASLLGKETNGRWYSAHGDWQTPSKYITSDEGKAMQKDMWIEVIGVLEEKVPRVKDVVASLSERKPF